MRTLVVVFSCGARRAPSVAATIRGAVSDSSGAAVPTARVVLRALASGQETVSETDARGQYRFEAPVIGTYLVIVSRPGFSEAARTVIVDTLDADLEVPFALELGVLSAEVSVTASRAEREVRRIPLRVETISEGRSSNRTRCQRAMRWPRRPT